MDDQVADQGCEEQDPNLEAGSTEAGSESQVASVGSPEQPEVADVTEPPAASAVGVDAAAEAVIEAERAGEPTGETGPAAAHLGDSGTAGDSAAELEPLSALPAETELPTESLGAPAGDEQGAAEEPAAVEAASGPESPPAAEPSMMELLLEEGEYLPGQVAAGDLVEGIVVRKDKEQLVLDIGTKQQAVVPINDLVRLPRDYFDSLRVGQALQVVVVRPEWREGEVLASAYQARAVADWQRAEDLQHSGEIVELRVVGFNKGGILLEFGQLQGFVPRSHLAGVAGQEDAAREILTQMVGTTVPVRVIEVNRRRRRLIMSHRQAVHQWRADRKRVLMEQLQEGTIRRGRVSSVADFGAFVDLGGADGLIHLSELTYERGKHPRDVVRVGQEVDVYVLSVDRERGRIGLSLKRLSEDPWSIAEQEHYVGELVEVTIVSITKFGAFARLEDGLEGLIHVSELADTRVDNPREVVRPGQRTTVEIIALDARRKRLGLSIRRVPEHLRQPLSELISQVAHEDVTSDDEPAPERAAGAAEAVQQRAPDSAEDGSETIKSDAELRAQDLAAPESEPRLDGAAAEDFESSPVAKEEAAPLLGEVDAGAPASDDGDAV